jgi:hypothetical protein
MNRIIGGLLPTIAVPAVARDAPVSRPAAAQRNHVQNFKDMALSSCIARAYSSSDAAAKDAAASASGFNEFTRYDAENATGRIPALIADYLARPYASFQGPSVRLDLMKCMDMYHEPELAALARRYVIPPERGAAKTSGR